MGDTYEKLKSNSRKKKLKFFFDPFLLQLDIKIKTSTYKLGKFFLHDTLLQDVVQ